MAKGIIVINCPKSGAEVPTGVEMERKLFEIAIIGVRRLQSCPACGRFHTWNKEDARIKEYDQ
jgi:hypothetical protein